MNKETVGLASIGEPDPRGGNNQSISELLRQTYDVRPVNIDNAVPANISAIFLSDISDSLSDIQYANLDKYLVKCINSGRLKFFYRYNL